MRYLGIDQFAWQVSKWRHEKPRLAGLYDELECFIYELAYPKIFDTTCTEAVLGGPVVSEDRSPRFSAKARPSLRAYT